jgi:hypothetical protein
MDNENTDSKLVIIYSVSIMFPAYIAGLAIIELNICGKNPIITITTSLYEGMSEHSILFHNALLFAQLE